MPLYFFEITKNGSSSRAELPLDLPDIDAAWQEATAAQSAYQGIGWLFEAGTDWSVVVEDEFRNKLRTLVVSAKAHKWASS